jgi:hypothetical protein
MWNYRIIKKRNKDMDEDFYFLSEVYYEKDGKPMAYTDNDFICGSTKEEIVAVLEMMLADAKKRQPALTEKDFKV